MANPYTTTDDLKTQALFMAGEPTNGTSDYDDQVLTYMQLVYDTLLNGGTLGVRDIGQSAGLYEHLVDIPTTDWSWLRTYPPTAFNTTPAVIGSSASIPLNQGEQVGTVLVTYGSDIINFNPAPTQSVENWRLKLLNQAQGIPNPPVTIPRIKNHDANVQLAVLDAPWPQETQSVSDFVVFQLEYTLPSDMARFCESPWVQGGWNGSESSAGRLAIGSSEQVEDQYPILNVSYGPPTAAARLNPSTIQMNRYDTFSYRIEFNYIIVPPVLALAQLPLQEPLIPLRFRHILAVGAAMFIAQDKSDSRMGSFSSEFREIITQMAQEYRKEQISGSERMGRMLYRQTRNMRGMLRTASGLPLW